MYVGYVCVCLAVGFKEAIKIHGIWTTQKYEKISDSTHPCFSKLLMPFFGCKLSNDFVAYRLDWRPVGDCALVGDVTKSPVEFHRLFRPVGLMLSP